MRDNLAARIGFCEAKSIDDSAAPKPEHACRCALHAERRPSEHMSLGRRKVTLAERERWVGNRVAEAYAARPPYPSALVDALVALAALAGDEHCTIVDIGAGVGHLALPLAARGLRVIAVDAAEVMLEVLGERAAQAGVGVERRHATAEALPLTAASADLAIVADALHFLDAHRAGDELARVLKPRAALAVVQVELADTPFMRAVQAATRAAAPRRPRASDGARAQLAARAGVKLERAGSFPCSTPLTAAELERVLASISFIGPAMNSERSAAFRARVLAIPEPRVWARVLHLHAGRRIRAR
jgi:2-polyprenyl-3-methyl-5-hydroxy-6-metoxy-1,4-benzoquinol methylase